MNDPAPEQSSGSKRKQIIASILTLATLIIVFAVIFPQFADYSDAWDAIQDMSTASIVLLVLVTIGNILIYVWPYPAAIEELAYGPAFVVRQTSFAISNGIPGGGAFGLAIQYAMLSGYAIGAGPATAVIGITSVWNILVTLSLPVLGMLGLITRGISTDGVLLAFIALAIVAAIVVTLALVLRSEELARKLGGMGDRFVGWAAGMFNKEADLGLTDKLLEFRASTVDVIMARWGHITLANVAQQLAQFAILWVALSAIQADAPDQVLLVEAFAAFAFARLASFIPITPGGLGTVDAAMSGFLSAFGASNSDALAAVLVWRAASFFPQIFIGIGTFLYWSRRQRKQQAA